MLTDEPNVIDYQTPVRRGPRWPAYVRWTLPVAAGGMGGWALSASGYGFVCAAGVLGFVVAAVSAAFAPRQRFAFGMLGNGVMIVTCLVSATISNWGRGFQWRLSDLTFTVLLLGGFAFVPALVAIAWISVLDSGDRS